MSVLTQLLPKNHQPKAYAAGLAELLKNEAVREGFWFVTSLLLFIALGPFAAIAALPAVLSLPAGEEAVEPESL